MKKLLDKILHLNIRQKLNLLSLSVALPLILINTGILIYFFGSMQSDLALQVDNESRGIIRRFKEVVGENTTFARLISQSPEIVNGADLGKNNIIIESLTNFTRELKISFTSVHGMDGFSLGKGHNPSELFKNDVGEQYVKSGLANDYPFSLIASTEKKPVVLSINPIYSPTEKGKRIGMVSVGYFFDDNFAGLLRGAGRGEVVFLLAGSVLGSTLRDRGELERLLARKNLEDSPKIKLMNKIYRTKKIDMELNNLKAPVSILVMIDVSEKHTAFLRSVFVVTFFLLLSIVVGFLLSIEIAKKIARPINDLTAVSRELSEGNYDVQALTNSGDELEILGRSFNEMKTRLQHSFNEKEKLLSEIKCNNQILEKEIQEKEKAESELIKTKSLLSNIIQSMPSMLITLDEQGTVTQWNNAAEITTGIKAMEILGKNIWDATNIFQAYKDSFLSVIENRIPVHFHRKKMEEQNERYCNVSLFPLIENGIRGMVIRMDDITEMETKEGQLRQAQKMETVGTLAGGLAHDFNNVLGGIVGTISIIEFKMKAGKDIPFHALKDYIDTIKRSSQRAAEMVQQLLTLSRKSEVTFAPVDLNLTIKHVMKICSNTFDKSVELRQHPAQEDAIINADPMQIEQVLLNLCVNGHHAMTIMRKENERPGGTLNVSVRRIYADRHFCTTHTDAAEGVEYWVLSIQDTGIGMDTKTIAKIFDPFFTTKDKGKGTGLGLAMVYNIVKMHNGFIDVYSEYGLGSTFSVYLPSMNVDNLVSEVKKEAEIKKGQGTILVVDDEEVMRDLAREILEECGYDVLIARDGQEAIDVFARKHEKIDMVLLDMNMPKKSGKEAYIGMKQIDPSLKVLIASGFRKDERAEEILSLGVQGFLQKPYMMDQLAEAISKTMAS